MCLKLAATFFRFWTFNHRMSLGWSFLNLFFLTDWFQYRTQRRYHFEWDASSRTWQVCRGSYWNKWPGSEGVLSGEGVYGILAQTDFCFTTADTWQPGCIMIDTFFQKIAFLTLERFSHDLEMKTREQNRNNKRTEIERFDWFIERIQTRVAFWLVKRTLGWKNFMPENFLEINRDFALTSYCNMIGQSNNSFSILGFSLARKRRGHVLIFSSTGW